MKKQITTAILLCSLLIGACKKKENIRVIPLPDTDVVYDEDVYKPGANVYGTKEYVRMIVGDANSPIILSSPHDGTVSPSYIPERSHSSAVTVRDIYVTDLVLKMADSLQKLTGLRPHVIINEVSRAKMEPNRALADAYLTHPEMEVAWNEYQNFIKVAREIVKKNVGKGLYLDMHGHGHDNDRIEVGYLLTSNQLNSEDASIDYIANKSSIYAIGKASPYTFSQLINGDVAFGTLLANHNCPSVPSKQDPRPWDDEYFNGGYCTASYGSRNSGDEVSAIQLETPGPIIRDSPALRTKSSGRIARAIIEYFRYNMGMELMK